MSKVDWDVEKVLLVVMGLLVLGGMGFIFVKKSEIKSLTSALPTAESQLARIGKRYQEIALLERERDRDEMAKGARPIDYLYTQMTQSGIGKRAFSIESPSSTKPFDGYVDSDWELKVKQGEKEFSREAIGKLLLYIEANTNRMRVSRIRLTMAMGRDAQPDHWEPIITVTDRMPVAE